MNPKEQLMVLHVGATIEHLTLQSYDHLCQIEEQLSNQVGLQLTIPIHL